MCAISWVISCWRQPAFGGYLTESETADGSKEIQEQMVRLHRKKELSDDELVDLMGFVNTIITYITNGNKNEERAQEVQ